MKQDAFATEVDLDGDNGEYFKTGNTLVIGKDEKAATALLLAKTGADDGISLVMVSDGTKCVCYIMRTADASPVNRTGAIKEMNKNATVTVADGFVYTLPFVSASTHLKTEGREYKIKSGDALKVVGEVTKADNPFCATSIKWSFQRKAKRRSTATCLPATSRYSPTWNRPKPKLPTPTIPKKISSAPQCLSC